MKKIKFPLKEERRYNIQVLLPDTFSHKEEVIKKEPCRGILKINNFR